MSKRIMIIVAAVLVIGAVAALSTVLNKRWWLRRAMARWTMRRSTVAGVVWVSAPGEEFREDYLLSQPLRRLREFYDTGTMKDPAAVGATIEQDATDE